MDKVKPFLLPLLVFLLLVGGSHLLFTRIEKQNRQASQAELDVLCAVKVGELQVLLAHLLDAPRVLGALFVKGDGDNPGQRFQAGVRRVLDLYPGVEALCLAQTGVLTHIYPHEGFGAMAGSDIPGLAERFLKPWDPRTSRSGVLLGVLRAARDRRAVFCAAPMGGDSPSTLAVALTGVETIVSRLGLGDLAEQGVGYSLEERVGLGSVRLAGTGWLAGAPEVSRSLEMPGLSLVLRIGRGTSQRPETPERAGFWLATACALLVSLALVAHQAGPARTSGLLARRTGRLLAMSRRLAREMRSRREAARRLMGMVHMNEGLFQANPWALLQVDPGSMGVVRSNVAANLLLGVGQDALPGRSLEGIVDLPQEELGRLAARVVRGETVAAACRLGAQGGPRRCRLHAWLVRQEGQALMLCLLQDVEQETASREALERRVGRYEDLLASRDWGVVLQDPQGIIEYASPGAVGWSGGGEESFKGKSFMSVLPPQERPLAWKRFKELAEGLVSDYSALWRFTRPDGSEGWLKIRVSALKAPDGALRGVLAAMMDVSDVEELLAARGFRPGPSPERLAHMAHEMRSALNAARGSVELVLRSPGVEAGARGNLKRAIDACDQALRAVNACTNGQSGAPSGGSPAGEAPALPTAGAEREPLEQGLAGARVLVVDDDPLNRHTLERLLALGGVEAVLASSGERALQELAQGDIDLAFLDLRMPGMDGYETLQAIRRLPGCGGLPVVALTGSASVKDHAAARAAGMAGYLEKPLDAQRLFKELRRHLPGGRKRAEPPAVLDSGKALGLLLGNDALYRRLLGSFQREYAGTGGHVRALLAGQEVQEAARALHVLKGLAMNLGGAGLADACAALEGTLRAPATTGRAEGLAAFEDALERFLRGVRQYLGD